jgi:ribosomal protein S18 acetylase RimI-like enzyme
LGSRLRIGALDARDRDRLADILRATTVFRDDEIAVALELFDDGVRGLGSGVGKEGSGVRGPGSGTAVTGDALRQLTPDPGPLTPDYIFIGAFTADDQLVGYACYGPTPATDRTWDLYWIAVDPAVQGTGSGTLLLTEVERRLEAENARMLVVETSSRSDYAATRRFYERRGYDEAARLNNFYAPADDRIIYTKRFHAPHAGAE